MARLEDLKKPLADSTIDEIRERVRQIRDDRIVSKAPPKSIRRAARVSKTASSLIEGLSKEEINKLLAEIGEEGAADDSQGHSD